MALAPSNYAALKTYIDATPELAALPNNSDGNFEIARQLNMVANPAFYVWKSDVTVDEIMQNGFDWTRVDNLTIGKARIWEWMTNTGTLHPNQPNVRAGFLAVFTTAGDLGNRNAIATHIQRTASIVEKLFAVGTGTTSTDQFVGPATMGYEGPINYADVGYARSS